MIAEIDEQTQEAIDSKEVLTLVHPTRRISTPARVFCFFLALYLLTWGGHYTSGDGVKKVQWAKQIAAGGPYWTDTATGAPPKYGIGHSLLAAPGMLISQLLQARTGFHAEAALYTLLFVLNGALLMYLVARYLRTMYSPARVWGAALLMGIATSWWAYTKLDFTEPLVLTTFFAAFLLLREERVWAGFLVASFLILLRTDTLVLIGLLGCWQAYRAGWKKTFTAAIISLAPALLAAVAINYLRFGTLRDSGYAGEGFTNPLLIGLYGMLFSAGKSVFLFSPPLVLGLVGWKRFRQRQSQDAWLFLSVLVAEVLIYSKWWDWSGDDSWGVRFALPGVMLMTIPCIELLERRVLVGCVLLIGLIVQLPAVILNGLDYLYVSKKVIDVERRRQGAEGWNRVDTDDIRFNPRYNQISGSYELLRIRLWGHDAQFLSDQEQSRTGTPLSQALRPLPRAEGCALDIIWCHLKR